MHSIERYGIVALLFLVVTVVAVLMWDGNKGKKKGEAQGASSAAAARPDAAGAEPHVDAETARRMSLLAENQPGPLQRRPRANAAALEKEEAPAPLASEPSSASSRPPPFDGAPAAAPLQASSQAPLETSQQPQAPREQPAPEEIIGLHADPPRSAPAATTAATHAYTVRAGDTLSEIAQHELGSSRRWQDLVAANPGLDPAKLHVGKTIKVPGAASAASAATNPSASPSTSASKPGVAPQTRVAKSASPAASGKTWKVGKGENLWRIAERALGDGKRWGEIAKLNPGVHPDRLVLGQVLALPGASAAPSGKKDDAAAPPRVAKTSAKKASAPVLVASAAGDERGSRRGGKVK